MLHLNRMQKICYDNLVQCRFINNLHSTLEKRLTNSFSPYSVDFQNVVSLDGCLGTLNECSASVAIRVFKGWVNGWATSDRYKNVEVKVLPCLFGCNNCKDSLDHYLICPHLFALWKFFIEDTSDDPLSRWGLSEPSKFKCNIIACIFSAYHAVRNELKACDEIIPENQIVLSAPLIRRNWSVFAASFKGEARVLAVQHSQFSLPSFLSFIS